MNKCIGCGSILQDIDSNKEGYTRNINNELCERCFRIKNYSDYKLISKDNNEFIDILSNIGKKDDLVVLVVDIFNIPKNLDYISKYINNKILLVLTKRDILPLSVYDVNLTNYFNRYKLNIVDTVIISSMKNYNFDLLLDKINQYKNSRNVYVVGFTNAGKSTMINKILYNYTDKRPVITTSMLPSTTIDSIEIEINDNLTLIDTPGLLDENNIIDCIDIKTMKKMVPTKEIKPKTYQIKAKQSLFIDDLVRIDTEDDNSLTFYISNLFEIERVFKDTDKLKELVKHELEVSDNSDIVINGLGFIKVVHASKIIVYTLSNVDVYVREALI
jgi:hypothetical protein